MGHCPHLLLGQTDEAIHGQEQLGHDFRVPRPQTTGMSEQIIRFVLIPELGGD